MKYYSLNIKQIIVIILIVSVFVSFSAAIIPNDFIYISERYYILFGISLIFLTLSIWFFTQKRILEIKISFEDMPVTLFVIYMFIRTFYKGSQGALETYGFLTFIFGIVYYVLKYIFKEGEKPIYTTLCIGLSILGFIQAVTGLLQYMEILSIDYSFFNISGTFLNPGPYANFLSAVFVFVLVGLLSFKLSRYTSLFAFISLLLMLVALILSQARTAWLAIIICTILLLIIRYRIIFKLKKILKTKYHITIFLIIFIGIILSGIYVLYHFKPDSAKGRLLIWKISLSTIEKKPLFGSGTGTFVSNYNQNQIGYFKYNNPPEEQKMLAGKVVSALNDYIQITEETGLTGLILFLFTILLPFRHFKERLYDEWYLSFISGILVISICSLTSSPLQHSNILLLLFIFLSLAANTAGKQIVSFRFNMKVASILLFTGALLLSYKTIDLYTACRKWKKANILMNEDQMKDASILYNDTKDHLNSLPSFLFNYGTFLYKSGHYNEAAGFMEKALRNICDENILMYLGEVYLKNNDTLKAEYYFTQACYLIPYMSCPRYCLFNLYREQNEKLKAYNLADEIYNMNTKVYSEITGKIKLEAKEYLDTHKPNN